MKINRNHTTIELSEQEKNSITKVAEIISEIYGGLEDYEREEFDDCGYGYFEDILNGMSQFLKQIENFNRQ